MALRQHKIDFESTPLSTPFAGLTPDAIFEGCNEKMLRELFTHEDNRLEKKPSTIHSRDLSEYFSMWANTAPSGGIIVVGIRNDRSFEGCASLHPNQRNGLEKTADTFCPDASYSMKQVPIQRDGSQQGDFLILFRVFYNASKVVQTTSGWVFIRHGDSKKELKGETIGFLRTEKGEVQFEREPCRLAYPQDFDLKHVHEFAESVRTVKGWDASHSREHILELMKLGQIDGKAFIPNMTCALLFATDPRDVVPGCRIRFLRFSGEVEGSGDSWNAVKDEFIDGTIPAQIQRAEEVLKSQLRSFSRMGAGGKFFTSPEYPEFAWYEAIVNACAHRCYGNGMKNMVIFIKMFDDRLVVESPGPFPPFVTAKNIYNVHQPRNPFLMDALFYLKFVKAANEGTKRMRADMVEMALPEPKFEQDEKDGAAVRVTLRNNIKQRKVWVDADVAEILGAQIANSLSESEKRCINFVAEYGKISVSEAQRLTGSRWHTIKKLLDGLVDKQIFYRDHRFSRDAQSRYKLRGT